MLVTGSALWLMCSSCWATLNWFFGLILSVCSELSFATMFLLG